ncbi:MAG TPA: hypothetical protein VGQ53_12120 [Chitinophagaceae bacterium]|jgi:hypothetical protein|nr:hypothetical protein [Chitinophagaceae bacterium]
MKKYLAIAAILFQASMVTPVRAQVIDAVKFFEDDAVLDASLTLDFGKLIKTSSKPEYFPATFSCKMGDSTISEQIRAIARGHIRKEICYMPPVKLNFHNTTSPKLYPLGSLKMVCTCYENNNSDQLLLKEYLVYKMYNLITDKSFRVRLMNLSYADANPKKKPYVGHAFLIESDKAMAKRNECTELKNTRSHSEYTNRNQMTIVAIFQYMIGNTDFGVSANHNIILIQPAKDSTARPIVVPYDFDYAGIVDAYYAVPNEGLDIENVRQRLYRGYARSEAELNEAIAIFNKQKEPIYSLVNNFDLLPEKTRKNIIEYLDDFYKTINNSNQVKTLFIQQARKM